MNMKPYIEYNGTTYEFEASFTMKRDFDRENKNEMNKALLKSGITEKQYEEYKKITSLIEKDRENAFEKLNEEDMEKLSKMFDLLDDLIFIDLYEKYCFKMLETKYGMNEEEFNSLLEGLANEYGIDFVDKFVQKVCEKVFTQVVEKKEEKKALPSWMI